MRFAIVAMLIGFGLAGCGPSTEDRLAEEVGIPKDDPLWDLEPPVDSGEYIDGTISGVATNLKYSKEDPTYRVDLLANSRLDYSIASVKLIDDYLEKIRKDEMTDKQYLSVVFRCGAYLGECVRRNSKNDWHWMDFKTAAKNFEGVKELGESIETYAVLTSKEMRSFPFAKVVKRIHNGPEDELMFYAEAISGDLEKVKEDSIRIDPSEITRSGR